MSKKRRHFRIYIETSLKNQIFHPLPTLKSQFYPLWTEPASQYVCAMNSQCISLECFNRDVGLEQFPFSLWLMLGIEKDGLVLLDLSGCSASVQAVKEHSWAPKKTPQQCPLNINFLAQRKRLGLGRVGLTGCKLTSSCSDFCYYLGGNFIWCHLVFPQALLCVKGRIGDCLGEVGQKR